MTERISQHAKAEEPPNAGCQPLSLSEAGRQSRLLTELAADPDSDEAEVMRWREDVSDTEGWVA